MPYEPLSADELKELSAAAGQTKAAPTRPKPLSVGQSATKYVADALPPLSSFAGMLLGGGAGAAAGLGTPASIPEAIWGGGMGGAAGGALGGAGQLALYKMAGIPSQTTIPGQLTHIAGQAALGGVQGVLGGGSDALIARGAPMVAKMAIGKAAPGAENEVLASGMKPTEKWIAGANATIERLKGDLMSHIQTLDASGAGADGSGLLRVLGLQKARQSAGNLLSTGPESALQEAMNTLNSKIGPQEVTTPASEILAPGRGGLRASAGPAIPASTTVIPAGPISYGRLQAIKEVSQDEATRLYEARAAAQQAAGGRATQAGPLELAYQKIATATRQMIEKAPRHGGEIAKANAQMEQLIRLRKIATAVAARAPSKAMTGLAMLGGEIPAIYTHNPWMGLAGIPVGVAAHMAQSPAAQLGLARMMASPYARVAAQIPGRIGVAAAQDITGIGIPRPEANR